MVGILLIALGSQLAALMVVERVLVACPDRYLGDRGPLTSQLAALPRLKGRWPSEFAEFGPP